MFSTKSNLNAVIGDFHLDRLLRYSVFVPSFYISPRAGQIFPLTKCIPRAAFIQDENGNHQTLEQAEIIARLNEQSTENPDQIDLEDAILKMGREKEIRIPV